VIQSENAPTLCPRCIHFTKGIDVGCRIGNYGVPVSSTSNGIQRWLREQTEESSWTYMGACPEFRNNGSSPHLMCHGDRRALRRILGMTA